MPEPVLHQDLAPHSVEISQNAKGELSFSVKVYADDEQLAAHRALAVVKQLRIQCAAMPKGGTNG